MTSDEISLALVTKEQAILSASEVLNTVQIRQFELKKELLEISESARKGKHNLSVLRTELSLLTREFWRCKNG